MNRKAAEAIAHYFATASESEAPSAEYETDSD